MRRVIVLAAGLGRCALPPGRRSPGRYEVYAVHATGRLRSALARPAGSRSTRPEPGPAATSAATGSAAPRRLASELAANTPLANGQYVGWSFTAPPDTTIGSYTLWRIDPTRTGFEGRELWATRTSSTTTRYVPFDYEFVGDICVELRSTRVRRARAIRARPYSDANRSRPLRRRAQAPLSR